MPLVVNRVQISFGLLLTFGIFAFAKDSSFEVLKTNHYDSHIVQALSIKRILENGFNSKSTLLVDTLSRSIVWVLLPFVSVTAVPDTLGHIFV